MSSVVLNSTENFPQRTKLYLRVCGHDNDNNNYYYNYNIPCMCVRLPSTLHELNRQTDHNKIKYRNNNKQHIH